MKNHKLLIKIGLLIAMAPFIFGACSDDEGSSNPSVDYGNLATTSQEREGATITVPLRGDFNADDLEIAVGGTATEGVDFEFLGVTSEGVQVKILEDDSLETLETVTLRLTSSTLNLSGNNVHTVSIVDDCEDGLGLPASWFAGGWSALEDYGSSTFGPYHVNLVLSEDDPNRLSFTNFYGQACTAYMIFDVEEGTVHFPDQAPCGVPLTNSSGTFEIQDLCEGEATLTINLNFDGGDWIYRFTKDH